MLIDAWFPFWGGGQVHVKNLSESLSKHFNCTVNIFYPSNHSPIHRLAWTFLVVFKLLISHRKKPFDLIHSHGFISGLSAKIASILLRIPCVHTVHGSHLMDKREKSLKAFLEKSLLTKIKYTAQITVSRNFLDYPNTNTNIFYIPNGVNLKDFESIKPKKFPNFTVLFVGRNHPDKGIKTLKKTEKTVYQTDPNIHFKYITNGQVNGRKLTKIYKQCHVFVLPSLAEGQPITILEAWAAKLPVIVTKVGDNPFMIQQGKNGFLFDVGDAQVLAQLILKLKKDSSLAKKIGLAGFRQVGLHHTWKKIAKQTIKVYNSCIMRNEK